MISLIRGLVAGAGDDCLIIRLEVWVYVYMFLPLSYCRRMLGPMFRCIPTWLFGRTP